MNINPKKSMMKKNTKILNRGRIQPYTNMTLILALQILVNIKRNKHLYALWMGYKLVENLAMYTIEYIYNLWHKNATFRNFS